jgi:parallel beta-helix repeat protein
MMQKTLHVGLIFLLIAASIAPSASSTSSTVYPQRSMSRILYVGGSGPENYTQIQQAIDNASDGDIVYVYHGVYSEYHPSGQWGYCVQINKSIALIGEDPTKTIINGTGQGIVVKVVANAVDISGFTIQNSGGALYGGIRIMDYYMQTTIHNNILRNNSAGIYIFLNRDVTIQNNTIEGNDDGIIFFDGRTCFISHNLIRNNTRGLSLTYGDYNGIPVDCIVRDNIIRDNAVGVAAENTRFSIRFNNFIRNQKQAEVRKGVYLSSLLLLLKIRVEWYKNYWDDWKIPIPRPVLGVGVIAIQGIHGDLPIVVYPCVEIDRYPHRTSYTIQGFPDT